MNPGPQDYRVVDTSTYLKRSRVIPSLSFTTAGKELESKTRRDERSKSPGPSNYRPQSACFLRRNPSCTIGNTKRILGESRVTSPGPSDYNIERSVGNGPRYHIANRYLKLLATYNQPGPSDYNYDPNMRLKRNTRVTIGAAPKVSCLVPRDKSPGPSCYNPNKLNLKKRHPTMVFNREIRSGVGLHKEKFVTPGPSSYFTTKWAKRY